MASSASAAFGTEVLDSRFDVEFTRDGRTRYVTENVVPILPANACFSWHIRLRDAPGTVNLLERVILPQPWEPWRTTPPTDHSVVLEDGKVAETPIAIPPIAGWIDSGWCIEEGDPPGPYRIEVEIEGVAEPVAFDFTYVEADDYDFRDSYLPAERERTVNNSW
jgi:hypothetical protein